MHTRPYWVLDDEDDAVVDRIAAGLGRSPARVLTYLLLRTERTDDPTTSMHLQVGTRLNRTAISDATTRLEERGLVDRSSVREGDPGRPQTAWQPIDDRESTIERTYDTHAAALLDHASNCHEVTIDHANNEAHDHASGVGTRGPRTTSTAPSSPTLDLAFNWQPNALHVPIHAAIAAGWYDTFDVDVRIDHHDGSQRALERVSSGGADLAVAGAATVVRARAAGEPVVPIALCYQRAMTVLYTVRDVFGEPLRSIDQLEGQRIGMPPDSETKLLGRLFLSQTAFDGVSIVDTNGEEREALRQGTADVVTGSFADPQELDQQGLTVDVLPLADHFPLYGPTIVVHEATLDDRRPALSGFLAGTIGGWAEARRDPRPAADRIAAMSDDTPERIQRTFERAATEFGGSDAVREHGWGWQRRAMWDRLRTALDQGDILHPPV